MYSEPIAMGAAAAWVGGKLLEGALQYAGGLILANALGQAKITDVRTWILAAMPRSRRSFLKSSGSS